MQGIIVELTEKESGFIERSDHADKLFFHADHLLEIPFTDLALGDVVEFTVRETSKGPYAIDVRRVN